MKVSSREFQRNFTKMREVAATGETVYMTSGDQEYIFQRISPRTWQGALKGKAKIVGDLKSTDSPWESAL